MVIETNQDSNHRGAASVSRRDLVTPLFRHRQLLLLSFLLVFFGTLGYLATRPKQYKSQLEVLVNRERTDPLVSAEATSETGTPKVPVTEQEVNSEAELIRSGDLLWRVVVANHLQGNPGSSSVLGRLLHPSRSSESARIDRAVVALDKALEVKPIPKSNLFEVTYTSPDPSRTYNVLNSLGNAYIERHFALQRPPGAYEFFSREADRYQGAMNDAEDKLKQLSGNGDLAAPELQRAALAAQVGDLVGRLNVTTEVIKADLSRIRADQSRLEASSGRITTARTTSRANILEQELGADLLRAEQKRTELALKYNTDYPLVVEADQEISNAQAALTKAEQNPYVSETTDNDPTHEFIREDLAKTRADLAGNMGSLSAAQSDLSRMRLQLAQFDRAVLDADDLRRTAKANEQNFLLYQAKREQERASDALDRIRIGNVAIAVPPAVPVIPVAPRVPAVLVAFGAALVMSVVLCYLAAYFDPSIHASADVEELLGVPVLVVVPRKNVA